MSNESILLRLRLMGCDVDGATERLLGDVDLFLKLLHLYLADTKINSLQDLIDKGDLMSTYDVVHDIKGVSGNLGLTPIHTLATQFCLELKMNNTDNAIKYTADMQDIQRKIYQIVENK